MLCRERLDFSPNRQASRGGGHHVVHGERGQGSVSLWLVSTGSGESVCEAVYGEAATMARAGRDGGHHVESVEGRQGSGILPLLKHLLVDFRKHHRQQAAGSLS